MSIGGDLRQVIENKESRTDILKREFDRVSI